MADVEYKDNSGTSAYEVLAQFSSSEDARAAVQALRHVTAGLFFRVVETAARRPDAESLPFHPSHLKLAELQRALEEVSDVEILDLLALAEGDSANRVGAFELLARRRQALEEHEED